ncbi:hypothetical protein HY604_03335 [Candidatus Peregrinibacteria bacterium]|nr:hypothetical protein [Candidatus Peregrinibacteria bacterium]
MIEAEKLHREFVRLGSYRHKLKNEMLLILPEIYRSGIYQKYAGSIVEYAGKFGDIARTTVIKRLRLEENLQGKPFLKAAIREIGVHKVAMLAKVVTPETDQFFTDKISNMSKGAVQTLSKEVRAGESAVLQCSEQLELGVENGARLAAAQQPLCKAVARKAKIELDEEATFLFMKLKGKLGKNMSDKEFLKMLLKERIEIEFDQKLGKKAASKSVTGDTSADNQPANEPRYIKAKRKRQAIAETNGKCSYPNCNNPYQVIHHIDRYSESKSHDSITPFCKIHHEFAHNGLIANERDAKHQWRLNVGTILDLPNNGKNGNINPCLSKADVLYRKYRGKALKR